jgi:O-antigen ligase
VAIAASLPAASRIPVRDPAGGQAHTALAQELVACAAAAVAVSVSRGWPRDRVTKLAALLVVLEIASAAVAPNPWAGLRASGLLLAGIAMLGAARTSGPSAAPLALVLAVAASVIGEALGVLVGWSRTGHAPGGLLGERNAASELLVCAMPWIAATVVRSPDRRLRAIACATLALATAAVILTRTRSAWLALATLAALGLWLAWRTADDVLRSRAATAVASVASGVLFVALAPQRLAWSSAHPYRETLAHLVDPSSPSGAGRLVQYANTWEMALAHPLLGVGPGAWADRYAAFAGSAPGNRLPSGDVLGFVAERGFAAALVALALAVAVARGRDADRWIRRGTLLAVLVVGSLDAVMQLGPHLLLVAWILGASMPAPEPRRTWPWFALAAPVTVAAGLAACRVAAFVCFVRASGFDDLERAAALDPGNVRLRLAVAESWLEAGRPDRARPHLDAVDRFRGQSAPRSMRSSSALLETPSFSYRFAR